MELNVPERVVLLNILPQQGNFATLRIIRELQMQLSFTEEELENLEIKNATAPDGRATVNWNPEKTNELKDIEIGKRASRVIVERLEALDKDGVLSIDAFTLYEKFVEDVK